MILGIDASTYLEQLQHGARFFDHGKPIDPLDAFHQNGVDFMRIRVWNDPRDAQGNSYLAGGCDIDHYVRLAALAKAKGYRLLLDFHYSDFWADPAKQTLPKAWAALTLDELVKAVYSYTADCLLLARQHDVVPHMIQVGNEITNGMLWPHGRLEREAGKKADYTALCRLLDAGCRACRTFAPQAKIVLHLEKSNDAPLYQEFFEQMERAGVDYDVIGASYYPYWHGTPEQLMDNLRACRRFGKQRMVVELGYGFTDRPYSLSGQECRLVIDRERAYVPGFSERYPLTEQGQADFVGDFLALCRAEGVDGVFYWEPLWLPGEGICWASEAGQDYIGEGGKSTANEWANQCLFDYHGSMLQAATRFCSNEVKEF